MEIQDRGDIYTSDKCILYPPHDERIDELNANSFSALPPPDGFHSSVSRPGVFSQPPTVAVATLLFGLALNTFREPMSKGGLTHTHIAHARSVIAGWK